MAKPPEGPPPGPRDPLSPRRDDPGAPRRDEGGTLRPRDWYAGRSGSRVSVEIQPSGGRSYGGGGGRFGDDRPPRSGNPRFGDRPPREPGYGGGGGRPRETHPPIDWEKWESDLEAALKARNGEG